jgi:hypothetical protein
MSKFITPRVVSTIAQSRLDYNQSTVSLLENFSSPTAPIASDINLEGVTGLKTGMFWYKSGGNSSLGQNRFLVYDGSSFTRNGISTFQMSSIAAANTAASGGNIEYGDLVLVGTDELYLVNSAGTGINRIGESATTLSGLTATQFLRSDIDTVASANLVLNSNNFVKIPIGSTAQRPQGTSARPGHIRYNTDLKQYEGYNETSWGTLGGIEALANSSNFAANVVFISNDGKNLYVNSSFKFNPSTNTVTAGIFSGNLNGPAVVANTVNVATTSAAIAFKVPFANTTVSTTGNYNLLQDSEATFTYNPSTNTLTAGIFSGNLNGAPNVATSTADSAFKVIFANTTVSSTGNYNLLQDSEATFTYNPSTNTLSAGNFNSTSDAKLKENIREIPDALDKLEMLSGYIFNFIGQPSDSAGLIAQELQTVLPQCVTNVNGVLQVNYAGALALLLQGFKEYRTYMDDKIESIESKIYGR